MLDFFSTLRFRNESLFYFSLLCVAGAAFCLLMIRITDTEVMGINAWIKPLKFCLSTVLFCWAMGWYTYYLGNTFSHRAFNWTVIICLGFEIVYIAWQAGRGELSHYNQSTAFYAAMFGLMAWAATLVTLYTAYVAWRFFLQSFPDLPDYYLWAIRLGLVLFVIFSFQGFAMGGNMAHTIGAADGSKGLPFVNWSLSHGDLRIAHFVGMHALQLLPILAFYALRNLTMTVIVAFLYGLLAAFTWWQALQGRALFS